MVQLLQPYMTTRKTIPLTIGNFFGRVMSLLFNKLSRSVIAFLPLLATSREAWAAVKTSTAKKKINEYFRKNRS